MDNCIIKFDTSSYDESISNRLELEKKILIDIDKLNIKFISQSRIDGNPMYSIDKTLNYRKMKLQKLKNIINNSNEKIEDEYYKFFVKYGKYITVLKSIEEHIGNYHIKYPNGIK